MEIDCGINCVSPELNGSLGVNHHRLGFFSDCTNHLLGNAILIVSVLRAWFVCGTVGSENKSAGLIVIFSPSIIAPESLNFVSHCVYSGLV
jgi:hypothetical protein